jgi:hypothetical protein
VVDWKRHTKQNVVKCRDCRDDISTVFDNKELALVEINRNGDRFVSVLEILGL